MIKRYDTTLYIDGKYISYISEHPKGDYTKVEDILERLKDVAEFRGTWGILMFKLEKLIEELQ